MGKICPAVATKRIQFEFRDGRGRHRENRTSRRRTYRSTLPRFSIWVASQTNWTIQFALCSKRTEWSSKRFGAAKGKGRTARIQNGTVETSGWRRENNSVSLSPKNLEEFFNMEDSLVAWKYMDGFFKALHLSHCSEEWRLFIDSSKVSLKAVFLHNGMRYVPFLLHMQVMIAWSSYCKT
jgi:hypothetical protein